MAPPNSVPVALVIAATTVLAGCTDEPAGPVPSASTGPYLGRPAPGPEPTLFAPDVVSTGMYERDLTVSPDGDELFFTVVLGNYDRTAIVTARMEDDGSWPEPTVAPFSGRYRDLEAALSPDGERLYFASNRPIDGDGPAVEGMNLWVVDRTVDGWGEPRPLPPPVRSEAPEFFPSVTRDGTLYFTRDGEDGASSVWRARPDGTAGYAEPERLPAEVNSVAAQFNAWIDADERTLLFAAAGRDDSLGRADYYVAFRGDDDAWVGPVHLGETINTASGLEYSASLSPDGRVMFFMAARPVWADPAFDLPRSSPALRALHDGPRNGLPDIWWVDAAAVLDPLRGTARAPTGSPGRDR